MNTKLLIYILIALVIIAAGMFILKSVVKTAVLAVIIVVLFRVGWIYSSDDITNKFKLDKILNRESYAEFRIMYDDYVEKREADPIINPEGLEETIKIGALHKAQMYLDFIKNDSDN